ncbi:MAG: histidine phosphatase family protein, partial [Geobacter sp.]
EVEGAGTARYNGHADVALTERGLAQYHALKPRFDGARIAACYTSDLSRCAIGAEILGNSLELEPVKDRNLRELDIGIWEGKTWMELQSEYPDEWQARLADIVTYRVPLGENLLDLQGRIMPVINEIVERHQGEEVLVVAHGGANRVILLNAIGAPLSALFNIEQNYCCLNIIDYYTDGKAVVKLLNG